MKHRNKINFIFLLILTVVSSAIFGSSSVCPTTKVSIRKWPEEILNFKIDVAIGTQHVHNGSTQSGGDEKSPVIWLKKWSESIDDFTSFKSEFFFEGSSCFKTDTFYQTIDKAIESEDFTCAGCKVLTRVFYSFFYLGSTGYMPTIATYQRNNKLAIIGNEHICPAHSTSVGGVWNYCTQANNGNYFTDLQEFTLRSFIGESLLTQLINERKIIFDSNNVKIKNNIIHQLLDQAALESANNSKILSKQSEITKLIELLDRLKMLSLDELSVDYIKQQLAGHSISTLNQILDELSGAQKNIFDLKAETEVIRKETKEKSTKIKEELAEQTNAATLVIYEEGYQPDSLLLEDETEIEESIENAVDPQTVLDEVSNDDFDSENNAYKITADDYLSRIQQLKMNGTNTISPQYRLEFAIIQRQFSLTFEQFRKKLMNNLLTLASIEEQQAYTAQYQRVINEINLHVDQYGFFKDVPIAVEVKELIVNDMAKHVPKETDELKILLNKWNRPTLTFQQQLMLNTIVVLGASYRQIGSSISNDMIQIKNELQVLTKSMITTLGQLTYTGTDILSSLTPGVNDYRDYCEFATGKEMCLPNGKDLSINERALCGLGIIVGSGKFYRELGHLGGYLLDTKFVKVAEKASDVVEDASKIGIKTTKDFSLFTETLKKHKLEFPKFPKGIGFKADLKLHLSTFDGFTQKAGIKGAHNSEAFAKAAFDNGVRIVETIEHPTVRGIKTIQYQIPALDSALKPTGEFKGSFLKTIYDPKVISDDEILQLGQIAAANGYEKAVTAGARRYKEEIGNITFQVYVESGFITNVFPIFKENI